MLNILKKTTASMASSNRSDQYDAVCDEDLSVWEFVNASLSDDDEDIYSFDEDDTIIEGDDVISDEPEFKADDEDEENGDADTCDSRDLGLVDDVMSIQSLSVSPPVIFAVEVTRHHADDDDHDDVRNDDDDDDDEDEDDDDLDDELMPWILKGKFGKQRIRKMGKRGGPNFNKSKRLSYYYNRPGCLYGKHGLGVQHSFI